MLTSNRSRELGDALKRRCLYQWIDYPNPEKEMKIVRTRLPGIEEELARQVVEYVQSVRGLNLSKPPGIAESLDCAEALLALGKVRLDEEAMGRYAGLYFQVGRRQRQGQSRWESAHAMINLPPNKTARTIVEFCRFAREGAFRWCPGYSWRRRRQPQSSVWAGKI